MDGYQASDLTIFESGIVNRDGSLVESTTTRAGAPAQFAWRAVHTKDGLSLYLKYGSAKWLYFRRSQDYQAFLTTQLKGIPGPLVHHPEKTGLTTGSFGSPYPLFSFLRLIQGTVDQAQTVALNGQTMREYTITADLAATARAYPLSQRPAALLSVRLAREPTSLVRVWIASDGQITRVTRTSIVHTQAYERGGTTDSNAGRGG